jgi:hypothetical protein
VSEKIGQEEYELGKDVTQLAKATSKKETSVVSVRLTSSEIAKLERIGRENGKTVSQVIREAIAAYRVRRPAMVVGLWNGTTVSMGDPQSVSGNVRFEVVTTEGQGSFTGAAQQ